MYYCRFGEHCEGRGDVVTSFGISLTLCPLLLPLKANAPETTVRTFMTQRKSQCAKSMVVCIMVIIQNL